MHELSLARQLVRKVVEVAWGEGAREVAVVHVRLGALRHLSPEVLRESFALAARGTLAENARLEVEAGTDAAGVGADQVRLESVEVVDEGGG